VQKRFVEKVAYTEKAYSFSVNGTHARSRSAGSSGLSHEQDEAVLEDKSHLQNEFASLHPIAIPRTLGTAMQGTRLLPAVLAERSRHIAPLNGALADFAPELRI